MRIIAGLPVLSIIPNLNIQVNTGKKGKKRKSRISATLQSVGLLFSFRKEFPEL